MLGINLHSVYKVCAPVLNSGPLICPYNSVSPPLIILLYATIHSQNVCPYNVLHCFSRPLDQAGVLDYSFKLNCTIQSFGKWHENEIITVVFSSEQKSMVCFGGLDYHCNTKFMRRWSSRMVNLHAIRFWLKHPATYHHSCHTFLP